MKPVKRLALIAHDNKKPELVSWAQKHRRILVQCELFATGTTGKRLQEGIHHPVTCFKSGPLGGDLEIGALIAKGEIDALVFFWDPLSPHPHDVDVKALLRLAVLYDIPLACNLSSANAMLSIFGA